MAKVEGCREVDCPIIEFLKLGDSQFPLTISCLRCGKHGCLKEGDSTVIMKQPSPQYINLKRQTRAGLN